MHELDYFFYPKSIAVIGGSERPGTIGRALMENLLKGKYKGKVYPVNIKGGTVFGLKVYKSIREIDDEIDLAIFAIPAKVIPQVMEECGSKGVKAALIISAGFSETGEEGRRLEAKVVEIARRYGIRIIGPNCLGIYNAENGLDTIFNPSDRQDKPKMGSIAFLSQSGALGAAILDWAAMEDIGMSKFISYGNAADVDESDLIEYLGQDEKTKVIALYIEGAKNGRKFLEACSKVSKLKPIVALKAGKTERGVMAVSSHTGSLAGSYQIYSAVFKQTGVIKAESLRELFAKAKALALQKPAKGRSIAIVTNGGGAGVLATDASESMGLKLATLSKDTVEKLREKLPQMASTRNPVDILGDAPASRYKHAIEIVLEDPSVHGLIVIMLFQSPALDAEEMVEVFKRISKKSEKPIIGCAPGGRYAEKYAREIEATTGVPVYKTPLEAVYAMHALVERGELLGK